MPEKFNFFEASKRANEERKKKIPHLYNPNIPRLIDPNVAIERKLEPKIKAKKSGIIEKLIDTFGEQPILKVPKIAWDLSSFIQSKLDEAVTPPSYNPKFDILGTQWDVKKDAPRDDIMWNILPINDFKFFKGKPKPFKHNPRSRFEINELGRASDLKNPTPLRYDRTGWGGSVPQEVRPWDLLTTEERKGIGKKAKKALKEPTNLESRGQTFSYQQRTLGKNKPRPISEITREAIGKFTKPTISSNIPKLYESMGVPHGVPIAHGPIPKLNMKVDGDVLRQLYEEWIWKREAASASGAMKAHEFNDLRNLKTKGITDFQRFIKGPVNERIPFLRRMKLSKADQKLLEETPNTSGTTALVPYKESQALTRGFQYLPEEVKKRFTELNNYFTSKYKFLTEENDFTMHFKKSYLPQMWKESHSEVEAKLGKKLTRTPGFTLQSVIENYEEGIKKGLTPVYDNLADLVGHYERSAEKAIADRAFFDELRSRGWLRPEQDDSRGWVNIERFPKYVVKKGKETIVSRWQAPEEIAMHVNNYLNRSDGFVNSLANGVSRTKNFSLSSGIPGTAINVHGGNIARRIASVDPRGMIPGAYDALRDLFKNGKRLTNEKMELFSANKDFLLDLVKRGYSVGGIEDHATLANMANESGKNLKGIFTRISNKQQELFENPLFQGYLPKNKFKFAMRRFEELTKHGINREDALRRVAEEANDEFGGMGLATKLWTRKVGDNTWNARTMYDAARIGLLAPDWLASNVNIARKTFKGLNQPFSIENRTYMRGLGRGLALRGAAAGTGAILGKSLLSKTPGLNLGTTNSGRERNLPSYGTAFEMLRVPEQILLDQNAPIDFFRNRLSIPVKSIINIAANKDDMNNELRGRTKYGKTIPLWRGYANVGKEAIAPFLPPPVSSLYDWWSGRLGPEEALSSAFELPFQYRFPQTRKQRVTSSPFAISGSNPFQMNSGW